MCSEITLPFQCESEWTPGVGDGQGGLACCDSRGRKESDTTEQLNWTGALSVPNTQIISRPSKQNFQGWDPGIITLKFPRYFQHAAKVENLHLRLTKKAWRSSFSSLLVTGTLGSERKCKTTSPHPQPQLRTPNLCFWIEMGSIWTLGHLVA